MNNIQKYDLVLINLPLHNLMSPPIGTAILKSICQKAGYKCKIFDLNMDLWIKIGNKNTDLWLQNGNNLTDRGKYNNFYNKYLINIVRDWAKNIITHNPDWVGISIFSSRNYFLSGSLCYELKQINKKIKIVAGGATGYPFSLSLKKTNLIDAFVNGDGEISIVKLLAGNMDYKGINNVKPETLSNLNDIPLPDYSDFPLHLYIKDHFFLTNKKLLNRLPELDNLKKGESMPVFFKEYLGCKVLGIIGSKGCIQKCTYCTFNKNHKKFSTKDSDLIFTEMVSQNTKFSITHFSFRDNLINGDINNLEQLCDKIIKHKKNNPSFKITWSGEFVLHLKQTISSALLNKMFQAGVTRLTIGVESGDFDVRKSMGKNFTNEILLTLVKNIAKTRISIELNFIIGYPTETESNFNNTLNILNKLTPFVKSGSIISIYAGATLIIQENSYLSKNSKTIGIQYDDNGNWFYKDNTPLLRLGRLKIFRQKALDLGFHIADFERSLPFSEDILIKSKIKHHHDKLTQINKKNYEQINRAHYTA